MVPNLKMSYWEKIGEKTIEERTSLENLCKILVRLKTGGRLKDLLSTPLMGDNFWVLGLWG